MTDTLEKLLALEEIRLLKARRCRAVDDKDWELYRACHTPSAKSFALGSDSDPIVGRDAMTESLKVALAGKTTVHHVHTPEITVLSPVTAEGIWAMEDMLWWQHGGVEHWTHGYGRYFETYEKLDGQWLIASRRLVRQRVDHGTSQSPDPMAARAGN
jgi:hypothetical protein